MACLFQKFCLPALRRPDLGEARQEAGSPVRWSWLTIWARNDHSTDWGGGGRGRWAEAAGRIWVVFLRHNLPMNWIGEQGTLLWEWGRGRVAGRLVRKGNPEWYLRRISHCLCPLYHLFFAFSINSRPQTQQPTKARPSTEYYFMYLLLLCTCMPTVWLSPWRPPKMLHTQCECCKN